MDAEALRSAISHGFEKGLAGLDEGLVHVADPSLLVDIGREAAELVLRRLHAQRDLSKSYDTAELVEILGITRQALAKRRAAGSVIGAVIDGTSRYPAWQIDFEHRRIRPEIKLLFDVFAAALGPIDPLLVASWAETPQGEDLDGLTPAEWLCTDRDLYRVIECARRTADRLDQ